MTMILESERETQENTSHDVIVCGAGPAGICAAIAAARKGSRTLLLEAQGCLGGVWTSGLLSLILDARNKVGLIEEIRARLIERQGISEKSWLYDAEEMKYLLEQMATEAGVDWILHTRVVAVRKSGRQLSHVVVENKTGRSAYPAKVFIDTTGEGDLAALAGCHFDFGQPETKLSQPMTLMAIVHGVPESIKDQEANVSTYLPKQKFRELLLGAGHDPSYSQPSLFPLPYGFFCLMIHHGYGFSGLNAEDVTKATTEGRREVTLAVEKLRSQGAGWENLRIVSTAHHVGVREGRRIRGVYQLTHQDVTAGLRVEDAVCRVTFPVDVHSLRKEDGGGYDTNGITSQPYDIPYRSLLPSDCEGLLLAGRCISGDFYAHASYRVTGNACVTGEAAGKAAAYCAQQDINPHEITWSAGQPVALSACTKPDSR